MREENDRPGTSCMGITVHFLTLFLWSLMGLALGGIGGLSPDLEKIFNNWQLGFCHFQGYWIGFGMLFIGLVITYIGRQLGVRFLRRKR